MKHFEKIKPYGDADVTLQFKTHDQNLQVCLKWETKIMLKQLFSHQNKGNRLETKFYLREILIKIVSFWIRRIFFCSYVIALHWNFPKIGNEFK